MRGHIPIRTCICCGVKGPVEMFFRLTLERDGVVRPDTKGKKAGRGAYICKEGRCVSLLSTKKRSLSRTLKGEIISIDLSGLSLDLAKGGGMDA